MKGPKRGIVLAAGEGTRLRPLTDSLPKTLLTLDGDRTILDLALANLSEAGVAEVAIVTGFAAERIDELVPGYESQYGLAIETIFNDKAREWNNAYSLWLARERFVEPAILVNGDTVHPLSVIETVIAHPGAEAGAEVVLAVDDRKSLAEEEMKLHLDERGRVTDIHKGLDPTTADGEYIGVTKLTGDSEGRLADALQATFERDTNLYYEDGFQALIDRGGDVQVASIGPIEWVEVDNHDDLAKARELICRY